MKKIFNFLFTVLLIGLYVYYFNDITLMISKFLDGNPSVYLDNPNEYKKNQSYLYIKETDNLTPYSKQDLLNIFYTVLNNGTDMFTFYCPSEYEDCINDTRKLTDGNLVDPNFDELNFINTFVSPYNSFSKVSAAFHANGEVNIMITKLYDNEMIKEINNKIDDILRKVVTSDMKDEDKVLVIHDYIVNNTKYDKNHKNNSLITNSNTAYGTLIEGLSVCSGYADAMALFLNRLNINNYKISTNSHVWNAIYVNDTWLHLDLTWDDPIIEGSNEDVLRHDFYLINTKKLEDYKINDHDFNKTIYRELA